ncbi:hypothetical protein TKK_0015607 [Trichogramma kaykai]|uniref:Uncharacterized protein n=1 Tax=Trichogramma kaykai TaxID=54128 RepID=A0ABD2WAK4_9HYME
MEFSLNELDVNQQTFFDETLKLILFLYSLEKIPRNIIDQIIGTFNNWISQVYVPLLNNNIRDIVQNSTYKIDDNFVGSLRSMLSENKFPLENFLTEHQRFKILKKNSSVKDHTDVKIGEQSSMNDSTSKVDTEEKSIVHLPLDESLKIFLELPGILEEVIAYIKTLKNEKQIISNIMQGSLWKTKYEHLNKTNMTLPLVLFFDDFEPGNGLGSHAGEQKLGGAYMSMPFLTPRLVSKLENILVSSVFYSTDRECFGNKVFSGEVKDFNKLSREGLSLQINDKIYNVFFECVLITGDNLGLNSICGFDQGFNSLKGYWCRSCRATGEQARYLTEEIPELLRNELNYETDLVNKTGGVREKCIFNDIDNFHIATNQIVDVMHDFCEGLLNDTISKILTVLIIVDKKIILSQVNERINDFEYCDFEKSNKPRPLSEEAADKVTVSILGTHKKIKLKQSASQMLCLARYLGLMIGDLIPINNKYWELYIILRKIIGIVTSPRIVVSETYLLKDYIKEHHELYIKLFKYLKPKFHFATHIPRLLREVGPVIHFWGMPFERKHTELKDIVTNTNSRRNLPSSICTRIQLSLRFRKETYVEDKKNFIQDKNKIVVNDKVYKIGTIFFNCIDEEDEIAQFAELSNILELNNKMYYIVKHFKTIRFDDYYHAYKIDVEPISEQYVEADFFSDFKIPCIHVKKNNELYVSTRYDI